MKKTILSFFITVLCLATLSCSYSVDFVVINSSDAMVDLEYEVSSQIEKPDNPTTKPLKMNLKNWNSWFGEKKWQEISSNEYEFDSQSRKYKLKLQPNEAIRIMQENDGRVYFYNEELGFNIISLRINGRYGEVIYQGKQLLNQFEKKTHTEYFINYKQLNKIESKN